MAGAKYYDRISNSINSFNAQINENRRATNAARYQQAQAEMQTAQLQNQLNDPRRKLAMAQATEQLRPVDLDVAGMAPTENASRFQHEMWEGFKPQIASIVGERGATIDENNRIVDAAGNPINVPTWRAGKIKNRLRAASMITMDEDAQRLNNISRTKDNIRGMEAEFKKTKNPKLELELSGARRKLGQMETEYSNPERRILSLRQKMDRIDKTIYESYSDPNVDRSWIEFLKDRGVLAQKELNELLEATGKGTGTKGLVLKRYVNPVTNEVIDYPVHKAEGSSFSISDPIVGNKRHHGRFVLKDDTSKTLTRDEAVEKARDYMKEVRTMGGQIQRLRDLMASGLSDEDIKALDLPPEMASILHEGDPKEREKRVNELEGYKKFYEDELQHLYKDPEIRKVLTRIYGDNTQIEPTPGYLHDDPDLNLLNTPSGKRVYGKEAPDSLFQ